MDNSDYPRNKHEPSRFNKELYFLSYITCKASEFGTPDIYSITKHTKIVANYAYDWKSIGAGYTPNILRKANPFGMVAAIWQTPYEGPKKIYDLGSVARTKGLWCIEEGKEYKPVKMLIGSESLEKILVSVDQKSKFEFKFTQAQIGSADFLAELYSKFNTKELNILASHRTIPDSNECINYQFKIWETNFQKFWAKKPWSEGFDQEDINSVCRMAEACVQIETKTDYIFNKIADVLTKLESIHDMDEFGSLEKRYILGILSKFLETSKLTPTDDANFTEAYSHNRQYMSPITKAFINLIHHYLKNSGSILNIDKNPEILDFNHICDPEKDLVIDTVVKPIQINQSDMQLLINSVDSIHNHAKKKSNRRLLPFYDDLPKEKDWDIKEL